MWSDRRYRRGRAAARSFHRRRRTTLADLARAHEALTQVDEFEVGFRDYVLEVLEAEDPVWAAKFLLRANMPLASFEVVEFWAASGQISWGLHSWGFPRVVEAVWSADGQPAVTVYLAERDYRVAPGVLDS